MISCVYGDIEDIHLIEKYNLNKSKRVISTVPGIEENLLLVKKLRSMGSKAHLFVTAERVSDALKLYNAGADYVILTHFLGGDKLSDLLEAVKEDGKKIIRNRISHITELKQRECEGQDHPIKQR